MRQHLFHMWTGLLIAVCFAPAVPAEPISLGASSFEFTDRVGNPDRPITVWTFRPEAFKSDGKVVFVMHGKGRNGSEYRDVWIEFSKKQGFLLLTPEFSNEHYPAEEMYQQGFIRSADGSNRDPMHWTLTAVERLFDHVVRENSLSAKRYAIYGHSGGGQFVHRLVLLYPEARVDLAIAANPGWYTMPDESIDYPYGLKGTLNSDTRLQVSLAKPLVVLLGEKDTDPNHASLRRTTEAMSQGTHRFARGHYFFDRAKQVADQRGYDFTWQLATVPEAEHSNAQMAPAAARLIEKQSESTVESKSVSRTN